MNIRTLCLGILSFREATGYEIKKMVEDGMFSHFIDASYGSIYPALTQMLNEGTSDGSRRRTVGQAGQKGLCHNRKGTLLHWQRPSTCSHGPTSSNRNFCFRCC